MSINELIINSDTVQIVKNNYILFQNTKDIIDFYNIFDSCINDKEKRYTLKIGLKDINNKDYILFNFMDINMIVNNLKYKKGSLVYEYVSDFLETNGEINNDYENFVSSYFSNILDKSLFKLDLILENNIRKIFQNTFDVDFAINDREFMINEMLKYIIDSNLNKKFIIFINSNLLKLKFDNCDNIIIFDVNNRLNLDKYNLISINNNLNNLNVDLLLNNLEINWPVEFVRKKVKSSLSYFFTNCLGKEKIVTNNADILIISKLMNKMYDMNYDILYDEDSVDNIIKSFLVD